MHIRIATRGSKLALWQAEHIAALLRTSGITSEIITLETTGDKILDVTIAKIGSKGVFTEELEEALKQGHADIAVHSAKDMPSELPDGFELIAYTEREQANDVLLSENINLSLQEDITIGTSSTRRVALLKHYYPSVKTVPVRGNLQTRVKKMREGACNALLLAYAGVHRMDYDSMIVQHLELAQFTPPVGQGSITIETYSGLDDKKKRVVRNAVNNHDTEICLLAERAFLKKLQGGCSIPAFAHAVWEKDVIRMQAGIVSLDGTDLIRKFGSSSPDQAKDLGYKLATDVLEAGGKAILEEIKKVNHDEK